MTCPKAVLRFSVLLALAAAIPKTRALDPTIVKGMSMVSKAHEAVCYYAYLRDLPINTDKYKGCKGNVDGEKGNIEMNDEYYTKWAPKELEPTFSSGVKNNALTNLPDNYQSKCSRYLDDSKSKPPSDESAVMDDGGDNYPYKAYCYCLVKTTRDTYGKKAAEDLKKFIKNGRKVWMDDALERGMDMMSKSNNAVCWYVRMKRFPNTDNDEKNCWEKVQGQIGNIKMNKPYYTFYPAMVEPVFSSAVNDNSLSQLPKVYQDKCSSYLWDYDTKPATDESDALNDGGGDYPYRAYTYCLLKTTRDTYGQKAIDDIKAERTRGSKDWRQVMLDQENLGRARHGVEPLSIMEGLNEDATAWAEKNAADCKMYHSNETTTPDNKHKGERSGENLAESGMPGGGTSSWDALDLQGYFAVNSWYNEIADYKFPADVKKQRYNHLTQSIWKGSKFVGYGMARNENCRPYQRYIAARYLPGGNMIGAFDDNVFPPKW